MKKCITLIQVLKAHAMNLTNQALNPRKVVIDFELAIIRAVQVCFSCYVGEYAGCQFS